MREKGGKTEKVEAFLLKICDLEKVYFPLNVYRDFHCPYFKGDSFESILCTNSNKTK